MKDFSKDKLNNSIRAKFEDAQIQPGNGVWEGIEAELLRQDNLKIQKKAVFYRNIAAAIFLVALISIYFNLQDFNFRNPVSTSIDQIDLEFNDRQSFSENGERATFVNTPKAKIYPASDRSNKVFQARGNSNFNSSMLIVDNGESNEQERLAIATIEPKLVIEDNSLRTVSSKVPAGFELPLLDRELEEVSYFAVSALDKKPRENSLVWNGDLSLGSGNFNPNAEITETPLFPTVSSLNNPGTNGRTDAAFSSNQEREAVEDLSSAPMEGNISFTVGFNVGVILNDKWNIKSGIQYGAYRASSSSSTVLRDRNSDLLFPYHGASSSSEISDGKVVNATSEYSLYNDFQIITVPLMASYKVLDRKFDISIVGGLSADFLIRNTLKGGSDQINKLEFDQSDRQSYKSLFASSLAGVEFSYPFANKYSVSLMPTYKKALSNVTTENATFDSMPAFLGLNMSLAYMF